VQAGLADCLCVSVPGRMHFAMRRATIAAVVSVLVASSVLLVGIVDARRDKQRPSARSLETPPHVAYGVAEKLKMAPYLLCVSVATLGALGGVLYRLYPLSADAQDQVFAGTVTFHAPMGHHGGQDVQLTFGDTDGHQHDISLPSTSTILDLRNQISNTFHLAPNQAFTLTSPQICEGDNLLMLGDIPLEDFRPTDGEQIGITLRISPHHQL